ncbi:hypothetical protein QVD17_28482 [Tagetes erecta]|uniref:Uncharacterized protein n=1 Tax=Tagetes erecta TaxID=13708 RepID=A0AAD8KAI1_TARER|nr:hypothetical protein QVD17_28482 [Tagetes erecta]
MEELFEGRVVIIKKLVSRERFCLIGRLFQFVAAVATVVLELLLILLFSVVAIDWRLATGDAIEAMCEAKDEGHLKNLIEVQKFMLMVPHKASLKLGRSVTV